MDIRKNYLAGICLVCVFLIMFLPIFTTSTPISGTELRSNESEDNSLNTSSFEEIVVDKVYNFTIDRPYVKFENNIEFKEQFNYYITVCVVTPHSCNLNITLWDPEGTEFQLSYEEDMVQDDYREVPFGTAMDGNYTIHFIADLTQNLNVYINIERGYKPLYDLINSFDQPDIIYYNVTTFNNGTSVNYSLFLKTDWYYQFYFGRVSAISKTLSNNVTLVHYIIDETQGIPFSIYINKTLASPHDVTKYMFGTAISGEYTIKVKIYCNVTAVNVAYAVISKRRIADETDPNDPDPIPDPPNNNTRTGIEYNMPVEWTVGIITFLGAMVGVPILIVVNRKKKNATGI